MVRDFRGPGRGPGRRFRPDGFRAGLLAGVILSGLVFVTCSRGPEKAPEARGTDPGSPSASARQTDPKVDDLVIARIGRKKITVKDLDTKIRVQFSSMFAGLEGAAAVRQKSEILKQMVNQYAWCEAGEREGFDEDPEFRATLELSRKFILSNLTVQKLVYDRAVPTEEEIRSYYEENADQFRRVALAEASDIVVASREQAAELRRRALAGESFAALAARYSLDDRTRPVGGAFGTVSHRSELTGIAPPGVLNDPIMALRPGEITEPLKCEKGWVLFRVDSRTDEHIQPLDEVRGAITEQLTKKKANELFSTTLAEVKRETGTVIDEQAWEEYTFAVLSDDEIFRMAQGEKAPKDRIRHYEGLATRRPDGERAAQALFMAAFTWADDLNDPAQARPLFERMLEKYPEHELAPSARWMLDNMDKGLDNLPYASQVRRKATGG